MSGSPPPRVRFRPALVSASLLAAVALLSVLPPTALAGAGSGEPALATDPVSLLTAWSWNPLILACLALSGATWLWLVRRVNRLHPGHPWPRLRTAYFLLGIASIGLAILSPVDTFADELGSVHMVQHMLLLMVGPPLLAASGPATLLLRASTRGVRERTLLPILHSRVLAVVSHPVVGWLAFTLVLWGTHYSAIYELALTNETVHIGEHLLYVTAACLFWWPIYSPDPLRWRMPMAAKLLYLLLQMPQMSFLAASILSTSELLYPAYAGRTVLYGIDPVIDQQASAAIMWLTGDMMFIASMLTVIGLWMRQEEAETKREDARLDRRGGRLGPPRLAMVASSPLSAARLERAEIGDAESRDDERGEAEAAEAG